MTREERIARRDELKKAIDDSPTWGAAISAMSEELHGLERSLAEAAPTKPTWIDRGAWIAGQLLDLFPRDPELQPERVEDAEAKGAGLGLPHLLWMAIELRDRKLDTETKACRWLGWLQAGMVSNGLTTLEDMKELNLQSGESRHRPVSVDELRTEHHPAIVLGGEQRMVVTYGSHYGQPCVFFEPIPAHLAKPLGTTEAQAEHTKIAPGSVALVINSPMTGEVVLDYVSRAMEALGVTDPKAPSFQARCQTWLNEIVHDDATDLVERRARFLERGWSWSSRST